jgi:hypothetical protein
MAEESPVSFHELSAAAAFLNRATDELKETIEALEASIAALNIGLVVWVLVEQHVDPADEGHYEAEQIGYAKVNGRWCIALRRIEGDDFGPGEVREIWAFNDAPRDFRMGAVEKLPNLMEELAKQAIQTAELVNKKLQETKAFTETLMKKTTRGAR